MAVLVSVCGLLPITGGLGNVVHAVDPLGLPVTAPCSYFAFFQWLAHTVQPHLAFIAFVHDDGTSFFVGYKLAVCTHCRKVNGFNAIGVGSKGLVALLAVVARLHYQSASPT